MHYAINSINFMTYARCRDRIFVVEVNKYDEIIDLLKIIFKYLEF